MRRNVYGLLMFVNWAAIALVSIGLLRYQASLDRVISNHEASSMLVSYSILMADESKPVRDCALLEMRKFHDESLSNNAPLTFEMLKGAMVSLYKTCYGGEFVYKSNKVYRLG